MENRMSCNIIQEGYTMFRLTQRDMQAGTIVAIVTRSISKLAVFSLIITLLVYSTSSGQERPILWEAEHVVKAQLAESIPLIQADRVYSEFQITGQGISVLVIDDVVLEDPRCRPAHGLSTKEIVQAVAPGSRVLFYDVRAFMEEDGKCHFLDIAEKLRQALAFAQQYKTRVINMSYGSGGYTNPCSDATGEEADLLRQLAKQGIILVAAAGNEAYPDAIAFPACMPEVISVGASYDNSGQEVYIPLCHDTTRTDKLTCYSNRAYFLDIVAPGTTVSTPSNARFGGTSAAAPIVTGVVALILESNPNLTANQVREILTNTGDQAYDPINNRRFPRVNAYRAVGKSLQMKQPTPRPPVLPPPPRSGDSIQLIDISPSGGTLRIDPTSDPLITTFTLRVKFMLASVDSGKAETDYITPRIPDGRLAPRNVSKGSNSRELITKLAITTDAIKCNPLSGVVDTCLVMKNGETLKLFPVLRDTNDRLLAKGEHVSYVIKIGSNRRTQAVQFFASGQGILDIQIDIFSASGHLVFQSDWVTNGYTWRAQDMKGLRLANGVYLYVVRVRTPDGRILAGEVKKMVILR